MFSRKVDYGLRALMYLAAKQGQGSVTLQQVAEDLRIPRAFLSKILQQLTHSGIVRSHKGPTGGFALARDPAELTVLEVVTGIDGPLRVFECFSDGTDCTLTGNCRILSVFDLVGANVERQLARIRLSDLLNRPVAEVCAESESAAFGHVTRPLAATV
jgi:Rrf2 family protein